MFSFIIKLFILAAFCIATNAIALPRQAPPSRAQIAASAPALGAFPQNNQTGDCDGPPQVDGKSQRVPCQCPPEPADYINALTANVEAGHAVNNTVVNVSYPLDDTIQSKHARITAAIITLQNLNGPGKGCPGVSTTLSVQANNLDTCGNFDCNEPTPASLFRRRQPRTSHTHTHTPASPSISASTPGFSPGGNATATSPDTSQVAADFGEASGPRHRRW